MAVTLAPVPVPRTGAVQVDRAAIACPAVLEVAPVEEAIAHRTWAAWAETCTPAVTVAKVLVAPEEERILRDAVVQVDLLAPFANRLPSIVPRVVLRNDTPWMEMDHY